MPLPPPRKPSAAPANNGRVTPGPGRPRGGGFILPPPPADSDAYSTDSDSSDEADDAEDEQGDTKGTSSSKLPQQPSRPDPVEARPADPKGEQPPKPKNGNERPTSEASAPLAGEPTKPRRKNAVGTRAAVDAAAAAAAAAAAKRFQQQQQHLIQEQRRKALQSRTETQRAGGATQAGKIRSHAGSRTGAGKAGSKGPHAGEADDDGEESEFDLGLGPGPSMASSQSLDMDIDGEELWTFSYCVVCDKLISDPASAPGTPGGVTKSNANTVPPSPTLSATGAPETSRRGSKASIVHATSGTSGAPVRRNHSSSRLSAHGVRTGSGASGGPGQPPRRTGSTGSRLNALSNLKPTTKLHQDGQDQRARNAASTASGAPSTSADSGSKPQLSRADSSASIASRGGSSSAAGSSPRAPSVSSQGEQSSTSSLRSRGGKMRTATGSKGTGAAGSDASSSRRPSSIAMTPSLSTTSSGAKEDPKSSQDLKEDGKPSRPTKSLYCSERCRMIDQQRSAGLGDLRPYLNQPLPVIGSMGAGVFPAIAPAAIAVTTVGSDQPAAVIPVASSTLSLSLAAASRTNSLPVLAATAVVAANASGAKPLPALVELAKSSAEGSATLNQGLSMSMGMSMGGTGFMSAGAAAGDFSIGPPSAAPVSGRPVLTSQVMTPLGPIDPSLVHTSSYDPHHGPNSQTSSSLTGTGNTYWLPDCPDCCTCSECLLADEETDARTSSALSGTAPSGSLPSDTATSEASSAALYGINGRASGSATGSSKSKRRTSSGRLLTPHNLVPLDESETDYFGAYPEQIRRVLHEQARAQAAAGRQQHSSARVAGGHHVHHQHPAHRQVGHEHSLELTSPAAMSRQRSQSEQSTSSDHAIGPSTMMNDSAEAAAYVAAALGSRPNAGRKGPGTATSSSTVSRPQSTLSAGGSGPSSHDQTVRARTAVEPGSSTAATSSASTSFSAAPTVLSSSEGPSSSAITAVPTEVALRRARAGLLTAEGLPHEGDLAAGSSRRALSARPSSAALLGTSVGTALHRAQSSASGSGLYNHRRDLNGSDSVRTTSSSRRSTIMSSSYSSPLKFLQPGESHVGSPSVASVDLAAMRVHHSGRRDASTDENEEFARISRRANWSDSPSRDHGALSIPGSSQASPRRGHRRAESAMLARRPRDDGLDESRPASVLVGGNGMSFGALHSLKRAQALAMARELNQDRLAEDGRQFSTSSADVSSSVSIATSLDPVREGRQEHYRSGPEEIRTQASLPEAARQQILTNATQSGHNSTTDSDLDSGTGKRRYSTGATSRAPGSGFLSSLWSTFRGGKADAAAQKDAMPRTETAPAAPESAAGTVRKTIRSATGADGSTLPSPQTDSADGEVDPEDRALITSANLDRGETIKPARSGRGIAGQGVGHSRRFDSVRSDASSRDVSVRSGSTGPGSDRSGGARTQAQVSLAAKRSQDRLAARAQGSATTVTKPTTRRGSIPFFTQEVGHGQIPGDTLEENEGRPRSFSNSSPKGPLNHVHRHSISNGAAAGVESVERRRLAKLEQQRAHRHQRSRDISVLPPLLAPSSRSNSASSSNLRIMHASSMALVHPSSARASSHGRIPPPAALVGSGAGVLGGVIPPTLRSPRSFQGAALVDPLVAGMGFSPSRAATGAPFYSTSPRGRGLGWGSSTTPLSAAGSGANSAAITPVASSVNLTMLSQPHSYAGSHRSVSGAAGTSGRVPHGHHGHAHAQHHHHHHHHHGHHHHHHAHSQTQLHGPGAGAMRTGGPPATGNFGLLGTLPQTPGGTTLYSRHATMPSLMYSRSVTPSVPEHGGEMSSEALSGVGPSALVPPPSPTAAKMFTHAPGGGMMMMVKPGGGAAGLSRPRSGAGWRSESPAPLAFASSLAGTTGSAVAGTGPAGGGGGASGELATTAGGATLPVGAIEGITLLTPQQYQEHLQQQQQGGGGVHYSSQQASRSRRTWSHEALSSMAGSGRTYPIMTLPGNGEVHDRYDEEWTAIIDASRREQQQQQYSQEYASRGPGPSSGSGETGETTLGRGSAQREGRKALFHFG